MNTLKFSITIPEFDSLLLSLIIVLAIGMLITAALLISTYSFLPPKENPLRHDKLHLPGNFKVFSESITQLPPLTKDMIIMNVRLDNYFMMFLYPATSLTAWYLGRLFELPVQWHWLLLVTCLLPLVTWIADRMEGNMTRKLLTDTTQQNANLFYGFNIAKMALIAAYLLSLLILVTVHLLK